MRIGLAFVFLTIVVACGGPSKSGQTGTPKDHDSKPFVNSKVEIGEDSQDMSTKAVTRTKTKCKYDTDCMANNPCVAGKCKLTKGSCRFRSECPAPRGHCVSETCEYY